MKGLNKLKKFQKKNQKYTKLMSSPVNNSEFSVTGTLAGFSKFIGINQMITKIAFVIFSIFTSGVIGLLLYLLACYFMPKYDGKYDLTFNNDFSEIKNNSDQDIIIEKEKKVKEVIVEK